MRFIIPLILIGISVTIFFVFSNPLYGEIGELRKQVASYDDALSNSKALEKERDELTFKFNSIAKNDLEKIQKFLPENIDNIRLILEIEKIALPYNMKLKDIKYSSIDTTKDAKPGEAQVVQGGADENAQFSSKEYGIWDLSFSTTSTYNNFLDFTRDLESNLRIVDISSISFSSDVSAGLGSTSTDSYTYSFKIKTYWLKN